VSTYSVKELFRTLQGEGANAGRVAVFCRFTGCNLWSGREADRASGQGGCSMWCDTDFVGTDGEGGGKFESADALADAALRVWNHDARDDLRPLLVCTGGEPLLQLDSELVSALHRRGFEVAIETNGTIEVPQGVDWVCVSPKAGAELVVTSGQELKLVIPQAGIDPSDFVELEFTHRFLQPKDGPDREKDLQLALDYCLAHPNWRLSLQTHKFIGIP
jgi:7-carboxy-7-deazaguanine synthase (Cx14CxxC type)